MTGHFKSTLLSCVAHGAAFATVFFFSTYSQGDDVVSASDPLLAMFADADADPNKAAGLIGELPGLAEGSPDGDTLEAPDFSDASESLNADAEKALEKSLPEPEPEPAPVPAKPEVADPAPANPVAAVPAPAKPEKPKTPSKPKPKPDKANSTGGKKISFEEFQKRNRSQKPKPSGGKKPGSGRKTTAKIDLSKIGTGGGGKRFGVPGGVGGNGGEGGRAVASAQQMYAAEIAQKLGTHLDNVLMQEPLTLGVSVSVEVRLEADSSGRIRLLEVIGSRDAQVRDRVAKAVARIGQFRKPPEGRSFSILLPNIVLSPM
ncbi:MAG: hypothetical protein IKM45_05310 [Opitutales bacterium]|nr:hypothetical protein [Opitutales bacterium]